MLRKPNFDNPTADEYLDLLDYEAFLLQSAEALDLIGQFKEARSVRAEKKLVTNRRRCMKAALEQKGIAVAATTA